MTDEEKIAEIIRLNDEALDFDSDGAKSSEGYITVGRTYGTYWDRQEGKKPQGEVTIYAYVLGPNRNHTFGSIDEALATMQQWHKWHMEQAEWESRDWDNVTN